jgi:phosphoinositide-3-kinase, regulatory subunit 4
MRVLQTLENPRHLGPIASLLIDRKRAWVLGGTAAGYLVLWDLRFGLRVRTWRVGANTGTSGEGIGVAGLALHPTRGKGRYVVVAIQSRVDAGPLHSAEDSTDNGSTQAEVWDIEQGVLVERFVSLSPGSDPLNTIPTTRTATETPGTEEDTSPASAIATLVRARQAGNEAYARPSTASSVPSTPPSAEARVLLMGVDLGGAPPRGEMVVDLSIEGASTSRRRGFMITGAEDRRIRFWDLSKIEASVVLSGPPSDSADERPSYTS